MISIKPGVTLLGLCPQMLLAIRVAEAVYEQAGAELVLTSGNDGQHMRKSRHYSGLAVDIRTRNLPANVLPSDVCHSIAAALGENFDVLLEDDHIHIEYDPPC